MERAKENTGVFIGIRIAVCLNSDVGDVWVNDLVFLDAVVCVMKDTGPSAIPNGQTTKSIFLPMKKIIFAAS